MKTQKPDGTDRGLRPGFVLLVVCLATAILIPLWLQRMRKPPAELTVNPAAAQPSSEPAPWMARTAARTSTNPGASPVAAASIAAPALVTPEGDPTAEYTQRVAQAMERAFGGVVPHSGSGTSPNPAGMIAGGTQATATAADPGLADGPAPGSSVEAYRKSDQARRALVEEMRQVRRAMLMEASQQSGGSK